jgi:hypothetical protein
LTEFNEGMFPYETTPMFQSAALMTSPGRAYWDAMPSDPLSANEFVRRFLPHRGEHVSEWNNLVNAAPSWLPQQFQTGDIYSSIRLGEARLPGAGLEALRNIKFTIPLEAEYIGQTAEEQLKYMTGNHMPVDPNERFTKLLGGKMAQQVANTISSMNNNVKMNEYVFNPMLNMSGKFDVVVNNTSGMKIKVVTPDTFERLQGPRPQDAGEMNALLNIGRPIKHGTIVYVNAATGETQEFQMSADPTRFHEDVQRTMHVRSTALNMIKEKGSEVGKAGLGYAYSRVDRLMVLADVGMNEEVRRIIHRIMAGFLVLASLYHIYYLAAKHRGRILIKALFPGLRDIKEFIANISYRYIHSARIITVLNSNIHWVWAK